MVRLGQVSREWPEIYLKLEVFQPIGSFKIRGAANAIGKLSADAMKDGV